MAAHVKEDPSVEALLFSILSPIVKTNGDRSDVDIKMLILALVGLYFAFRLFQTVFLAYTSPLRNIPGPFWSRFTNLPLKKAVVGGRRIFFIDDLHTKYGTVVRIAPTELSVSDIDGFKKIHSVSQGFVKNEWYEKLTIFPRHSVFTMRNTKDHAARRRLFAKGFSKTYLREHWEPVVAEKAKLAVEGIKRRALDSTADLMQWWTFLATDTVGRLGFGESFGMLELGKKSEYIRVLELALVGNGIGAELPWVRAIGRLIPARVMKEAFDATNYILQYGQKAVDNAKAQGDDVNLMSNVLKEAEKEDSKLDDLDVQVEATSLIFAGSGTTANTLTYYLYAVLQRPQLQKQIEDEVATLPDNFTDTDMESLPMLNATMQETLRLYCAVPGTLPRVVPKGGTTIGGYFVPEGTTVGTQAYTMHRKPDIFPDPHAFKPERWLKEADMPASAKTAFCAFGAGAYTCLGTHLAYMEMRYAAALFFRECKGAKLAPSTTEASMDMENYFVITPKGHQCHITLKG